MCVCVPNKMSGKHKYNMEFFCSCRRVGGCADTPAGRRPPGRARTVQKATADVAVFALHYAVVTHARIPDIFPRSGVDLKAF